MSKMPIAWHEKCLANMESHYQRERERVQREQERLYRLSRDIFSYEAAVEEAKKRGLDGFDHEKFGKKRRTGDEDQGDANG